MMIRAPGFWWQRPSAVATLLVPASALYGAIAGAQLARQGARANMPVLCVGNPTVGGAGKTPAALMLARMLIEAGERPAFLTRGYGGTLPGPVWVQGQSAQEIGDEPLLLARVAPTVVARDRAAGAALAATRDSSVIVMDDGFQNPSLGKDFSLLVVDGRRGLGNGRVLPAGPLRAPLAKQLDRAHAILIVGEVSGAASAVIAARARKLPLFHGRLAPDPATVLALKDQRVLAFAGIGDPEKFFSTLAAAGIEIAARRGFADHHRFTGSEAAVLIADATRDGLRLVTTEKDLARCADDPALAELAARALALPVTLVIDETEEFRSLVRAALAGQRGA